jgi:hypothetical protein
VSTTRNIFFAKIYAATLKHYDGEERQRQIKNLQPGQSLRLVRNHAVSGYNTAVKVCLHSGNVLGYLPPEFSDGIAILIDQGKNISAVVKEVRSGRDEEPWECLIEMKVLDMTTVVDEPLGLNQVGSKLAMGIKPWEEESYATPKATNSNFETTVPSTTKATKKLNKSPRGDFFLSLFVKFALGMTVAVFVLSFFYFLVIKQPRAANVPEAVNESSKPIEKDKPEATEAFAMAKRYVLESLKAPSTAKFPWYSEAFVKEESDNRWIVTSYVDSQNSFGAMLRVPFIVELTYGGNHFWRLDNILLLE